MAKLQHPVMLIVLDGWGHSDDTDYNAIYSADTPVWDDLLAHYPHTLVSCSGTDVGLPAQQMGNSEVGHMHIGAGRLIDQDFSRINKAIESGEFAHNPALVTACKRASQTGGCIHILGLLSPGGVHSHEQHIVALIDLARASAPPSPILVHAFLDGRDTPPQSAQASLLLISEHCQQVGGARIASVSGRFFAMDRNENGSRTERAYRAIVDADAEHTSADAVSALQEAYGRGETDEFVAPTVICGSSATPHRVADGDVMIFANFRSDRARQLTAALTQEKLTDFARPRVPKLGAFVTMTDYGERFHLPIAFAGLNLLKTFGEVVAEHGLRQLRIAETEKYAHVTFFFNGGRESPFAGEDRILVPSPAVATYDLKPEMSAVEVTDKLCAALSSERYDAIICNYANADMVGHTGDFTATVRCIETLDTCLGRVVATAKAHGVEVLITADHGNAEKMRAPSEGDAPRTAHTAHTSNLVPLVYVGRQASLSGNGTLADIAPTLLTLMGLEIPAEMTGKALTSVASSAQNVA